MKHVRLKRLVQLIAVLRGGRRLRPDDLAEVLGVSRRTLFRDLELLEEAGMPYRFERHEGGYAIEQSQFLAPVHFDMEEALALILLTRKFLARSVHPAFRAASAAALKLEGALPDRVRAHIGDYLDPVSVQWPPMTDAASANGMFALLQRAMAETRRLRLSYDSIQDRRTIDVILDPWRLVFITRGWYLLAHSLTHGETRTFKLDRILKIEPTGEVAQPPPEGFSEKTHFGAAWRMIPEGQIHTVRLRFSAKVAPNVEEVLWHASQATQRLEDGRLDFTVRVDGLKEIQWWILGYGDQVEVLAPIELRQRIHEAARHMVAMSQVAAPTPPGVAACEPSFNVLPGQS